MFRHGLRASLNHDADMEVVGEAADAEQALHLAIETVPDIVVIDADIPDGDGLGIARALKRHQPGIGIVLMAARYSSERLFDAVRIGAAAYVTKDAVPDQIIATLRRVANGEYAIDESVLARPDVAMRVLDSFRSLTRAEEPSHDYLSPLTSREAETLEAVAMGNTNKEIAALLGISDQTVKNHITSILRKLQVNDRTQAVIFAVRHGLIRLGDGDGERRNH